MRMLTKDDVMGPCRVLEHIAAFHTVTAGGRSASVNSDSTVMACDTVNERTLELRALLRSVLVMVGFLLLREPLDLFGYNEVRP
jgi:hypothetical protein